MVEEANEGLSKAQKHRRRRRDICDHRAFLQGLLEEAHGFVWPSSEELGGLGVCKAQGAEGQGAKHLQKARQFLEHRLHAALIKLEEEQHKQAIAHDDEQAKGALVDKEGPDHSGCDSGQSRKRRKTALSSDYNPCILKAEAAGGQPRCMARIWDPKGSCVDLQCGTPARKGTQKSTAKGCTDWILPGCSAIWLIFFNWVETTNQ